ncbi:MAG: Mov34/MPN/PAD-1 family protein [Bacteroidetes bacterium]|nr:Mov34/MPN/PAD-1 family protein [Bacteroidota bacterium]
MKIIQTHHRGSRKPANLAKLQNSLDHFDLSLGNVIPPIKIDYVFIHQTCVEAVNHWVNQSLNQKPVPEVGGFLLGNYALSKRDHYLISIEEFLPAQEVVKATPNRLEFGSNPFLALDAFLEEKEDLVLVGWLHTHPGHSPYLSEIDLYSHEGFFPHDYQVAIVLDPLTDDHDTGIFCRTDENTMTNKDDFSHWLNWKSLTIPKQ